jgi:putative salt-induced outer membrane protein
MLAGLSGVRAQTPAPAAAEKPKWQSSASLGMTMTRGNSETFLATAALATGKKWDQNEMSLGADMTYGKTKDQATGVSTRNADSYHGFAQYNRLFTERLYGYARVEGLYDSIADIKYRVTLSPGAGYYLIKEKTTDLSIEVGPGYVFQKLGTNESNFATLRVGQKFHYALSDRARIWEMAEWLPKIEDFSNYIINAELGLEADLTQDKKFTLRTYVQDTYNSVPASGRKNNDMKWVTAIAYKF